MPQPLNAESIRHAVQTVKDATAHSAAERQRLRRRTRVDDPERREALLEARAQLLAATSQLRPITGALGQGVPLPKSLKMDPEDILAVSRAADYERRRLKPMIR